MQQITINPKSIAAMVNTLENDEIGGAIRLLNRILATGRALPVQRARAVAQMDRESWEEAQAAILEHFIIRDETITHSDLLEADLPSVSTQAKTRPGSTADMPLVQPTRGHTVPAYTTREKPEPISIKRTAYLIMEDIFKRSDQSSNTARAVLAGLLKNWPEGDVYEAVSAAGRQQFLVDPRSWIIAHLQKTSRPTVAARSSRREVAPPPKRNAPRDIVTPKLAGVSSSTAERIKARNAALKLDLGLDFQTPNTQDKKSEQA